MIEPPTSLVFVLMSPPPSFCTHFSTSSFLSFPHLPLLSSFPPLPHFCPPLLVISPPPSFCPHFPTSLFFVPVSPPPLFLFSCPHLPHFWLCVKTHKCVRGFRMCITCKPHAFLCGDYACYALRVIYA